MPDDPGRLRVALDATPLLGVRTGVGRYVAGLAGALAERPDVDLALAAFTWRSGARPPVPGARWRARPAPARLLRAAWTHTGLPPVELLAGRCDVFHGTNFVQPPSWRAAGVVTVHDLAFLHLPETVGRASQAYARLVPDAVRRAELVLCPSAAVAGQVADAYRLDPARVLATPLGVDPRWGAPEHPAPPAGLPERYLLFVGTREPRKDLPTLLAAHRAARAADPDAVPPLVLAGPAGWGEQEAPGPDVHVAGFLSDEALVAVVAGAAGLVLPSRDEGFGLPVLEALACGTPVLASDLPVLREVGGDVAAYAAPGDVDAFAEALVLLCREPGDPAPRRARAAGFTWQACAERTLAAYRQACATRL